MSRPTLMLPSREAWTALADKLTPTESIAGLETFDVLAQGTAAADQALRVALEHGAQVHAIVLAAAEPPSDPVLIERLGALKAPVLTLFGTRDAQVPPAIGRRWRALVPGCHVVFLYDAGGALGADRPQALAEVVLDFLSDPGAFLVNRASGLLHP